MEAHAAVAAELLGNEALVRAVLADYRTAPISAAERQMLAYVERLNLDPSAISESDIAALKAASWTDEAIYDAVMVCGLFNFYNRFVDGTGDHKLDEAGYRASGSRLAKFGYRRPPA